MNSKKTGGISPFFHRLGLLTGPETAEALAQSRVIVFGLGGVGSWCAEALVRSALGRVDIVDSDRVCVTNINRQVQATSRTVGLSKAEALGERLREINPGCEVGVFPRVFSRESAGEFGIDEADYVIDAIDSLGHKLDLIEICLARSGRGPDSGPGFFSSMGMARKLDPTRLKTADIWETSGCPLARLVRQGLKKRGFHGHFTVVYSDERLPPRFSLESPCGSGQCFCPPREDPNAPDWCAGKKVINGSAVTVTATAGMILASLVLGDIYARHAPPLDTSEARREKEMVLP